MGKSRYKFPEGVLCMDPWWWRVGSNWQLQISYATGRHNTGIPQYIGVDENSDYMIHHCI